jgi:DNA-binding transcriptional regulator YhcF (GntR family)
VPKFKITEAGLTHDQSRPTKRPPKHGVSHITAERALTRLKDAGLITPVIGKGYYVAGT